MRLSPAITHRFPAHAVYSASAATLAAALIGSLPVFAAQPPEAKPSSTFSLGIGVASTQKPYIGIDRDYKVIPLIQYENRYVRFQGMGLEVKLPSYVISDSQRLNFGIVGRFERFAGYEPDDSPALIGMSERKTGLWAGGRVEWKNSLANVAADWTHDVSGHSKGQKFNLGLNRTWRIGEHLMLTPRAVARWQDKKYVDYYYGVRANEARLGRAAYQGESSVSAEVGLHSMYRYDRHHSVFMDVGVTGLGSEIKDSPLVDRSTTNRVFVGYIYRF